MKVACGLSAKASAGSLASCFDNRFHIIIFCVFEIRNGFSFRGLSAEASAGSLPSCLENCLDVYKKPA